jgi:prepilin-type N-terminal cleavage/methylation domain-containing protein
MFPRSSEPDRGFTLLEVLVGLAVSTLLLGGATRFFRNSHSAYSMQERITDRDLNGNFAAKQLERRIMEAGAFLPAVGSPVIDPGGSDRGDTVLILLTNPKGGTQRIYADRNAGYNVPVDDQTAFRFAEQLLLVPKGGGEGELLDIATSYSQDGFENGLMDVEDGQDSVRLASSRGFEAGDILYACTREVYQVRDGLLTVNGVALAENIDSLGLTYFGRGGKAVTRWSEMRSANVTVVAGTGDQTGDSPKRLTLTSNVRMRNRL